MKCPTSQANRIICLLGFFFLLIPLSSSCQKQDYNWLQGYASWAGLDTLTNKMYGISGLDFNEVPMVINYDSIGMNFSRTNTSYSDSNGVLLFYTNGIYAANSLNEKIERSDSMNAGFFQYGYDPSIQETGYLTYQGILAIEDPSNINNYYLLHSFIDTVDANYNLGCKRIYYTYLDMNANLGHGKVVAKDQIILSGRFGYELKATRHANGRDWWILAQKKGTNCYERILVDNKGIHALGTTCGGQPVYGLSGSCCFSQDGSKYVYVNLNGGINLFDFDRCSGELSNSMYKPLPIFADTGLIGIGTAFSPDSRFLYVNATIHCYQFDLSVPDVWASVDTVAFFDGSANPFGSYFHTMQIAPDGKIYSSCGNSEWVYHVIEQPNQIGDSCLFRQHAIDLPSYCVGVPNFINYRLGALVGSGCDTLTGVDEIAEKESLLKVYPQPSNRFCSNRLWVY
jgi:hypothetical protein